MAPGQLVQPAPLLGFAISTPARTAGGLLPGPLPSLKNRKPHGQQDWGEAGTMGTGQRPLAQALSLHLE